MRKGLALALGLLLALTALGVAWAAWSATLEVRTSVSAAPGFDVEIIDPYCASGKVELQVIDRLTLMVNADGVQPGETIEVKFKFRNNGDTKLAVKPPSSEYPLTRGPGVQELQISHSITWVGLGARGAPYPPLEISAEQTVTIKTGPNLVEGKTYGPYIFMWEAIED